MLADFWTVVTDLLMHLLDLLILGSLVVLTLALVHLNGLKQCVLIDSDIRDLLTLFLLSFCDFILEDSDYILGFLDYSPRISF